ncbi:XrtX-associated membrane protein [Pontibacter cellulosilyticus]|uniref:XrtX-associated membrane protein n=1 Tax=Pontibacter cellulosilyticus TaxID=1720253 RepID=UPI0037444FB0
MWHKRLRLFFLFLTVVALFMIGEPMFPLFRGLNAFYYMIMERELLTHDYFFRIIYCFLCLLIVHLYTDNWKKTKVTLYLYGITFIVSLVLVKTGKNISQLDIAYRMGAQLVGIMVSPFPVVLIIPALYLTDKKG